MQNRSKCGQLWTQWWQQWKGHKEIPVEIAMDREYTYCLCILQAPLSLMHGKVQLWRWAELDQECAETSVQLHRRCSGSTCLCLRQALIQNSYWNPCQYLLAAAWAEVQRKKQSCYKKQLLCPADWGQWGRYPVAELQCAGCAALLLPRSSLIIASRHLESEPPSSSTAQSHEPKGSQEMENLGTPENFTTGENSCFPEQHSHSVMDYMTACWQAHGYSFNLSLAYETF